MLKRSHYATTENEQQYKFFTNGSYCFVGKHQRWKTAVWSPLPDNAETAEGQGESSQFAEMKAIQFALDIDECEKWPIFYTDSWMVENVLWRQLQQWKQNSWQQQGKPIWLLHCGKVFLPRWKMWLGRYIM